MTGKLTSEQEKLIEYRKKILEDKLADISRLVNGYQESFYPFIENDDSDVSGEDPTERKLVSEKKAERLIADILASGNVPEAEREMYEAFLYCSLFTLHERVRKLNSISSNRSIYFARTFGDIVRLAEGFDCSECRTYDDFLMLSFLNYITRRGYDNEKIKIQEERIDLRFSYSQQRLSGSCGWLECGIFHLVSSERQEKLVRSFAERWTALSAEEAEEFTGEVMELLSDNTSYRYGELYNGGYFRSYETLSSEQEEEARRKFSEIDSYGEEPLPEELHKWHRIKSNEATHDNVHYWAKNIVNKERYLSSCKTFLEMYFSRSESRREIFSDTIKNMIDAFLFEHRLSAFSLGDDYGMISFYIERLQKSVKSEIRRGQRKG